MGAHLCGSCCHEPCICRERVRSVTITKPAALSAEERARKFFSNNYPLRALVTEFEAAEQAGAVQARAEEREAWQAEIERLEARVKDLEILSQRLRLERDQEQQKAAWAELRANP